MRKIICRFANLEDMSNLMKKLGITKDFEDIKEINAVTNEIKRKKKKVVSKGLDESWREHWIDMPEFNNNFAEEEFSKVEFIFKDDVDNKILKDFFEQNITSKTKSVWFPRLVHGKHRKLRVVGGRHPRYPVYVVSKGRATFNGNTSRF